MVNKFRLPLGIAEKVKVMKEPFDFKNFFNNFKNLNVSKKDGLSLFITILIFVFGIVAIFQIQKAVKLRSQAGAGNASFYFLPETATFPPNGEFVLAVNSNQNQVAFVRVTINFDKAKVKLISEPVVLSNHLFGKQVSLTSMAGANNNGKISYIVGLDPSKFTTPPSGIINLLRLRFSSNTDLINQQSRILIFNSETEIVDINANNISYDSKNVSLSINPITAASTATATSTSTSTPTSTGTATPTSTATPTFTPTPRPTSTVRPTITSAPTIRPTTTPTAVPTAVPTGKPPLVIIKFPGNGTVFRTSYLSVYTYVISKSGVRKTEIYLDDKLVKTCYGTLRCFVFKKLNYLTNGSHLLKVVGYANNGLFDSKVVTISRQ